MMPFTGITKDNIPDFTPREVFARWQLSSDLQKAIAGAVEGIGSVTPGERREGDPTVTGEGFNDPCYAPVEGEDDRNPFSIPREVVKARSRHRLFWICGTYGLPNYAIKKGDFQKARDLFDTVWAGSERRWNKLKAAFELPHDEARERVLELGKAGDLKDFTWKDESGNLKFIENEEQCHRFFEDAWKLEMARRERDVQRRESSERADAGGDQRSS